MLGIAFAAGGRPDGGGAGGFAQFFPIILLFVVFYFLLIRPQQKRAKDQKVMIANLKRDDYVMTSGGLLGRVTGLSEDTVTLEIADKVRVRVARSHISTLRDHSSEKEKEGAG